MQVHEREAAEAKNYAVLVVLAVQFRKAEL